MKKIIQFFIICFGAGWLSTTQAADLIEVFRQAQCSDPIFQQAIAQRFSTKQGVPIAVANLLPNLQIQGIPNVSKNGTNDRSFFVNLTVNQTIFNFAQYSQVAQQVSLSKGADATLNAALQDLMVRVSHAYFKILNDEDDLTYAVSTKKVFAEQLNQMKEQFKVGLKTQTDVYTAEASYDSAVATYINAQTILDNDRENLRVMTGIYYEHLARLSDDFPLVSPKPANVDTWVETAIKQNWQIKSSRYSALASKEMISQQFYGHFPTVTVQSTLNQPNGNTSIYTPFYGLNITVPVFAGGGIVAQTNQAKYNYQVAQQQLEQITRNAVNTVRQSFRSIIAGISQIKADRMVIKSTSSSFKGLELSYKVGLETLVNVLEQQQKVFDAQRNYARDRYSFVNNLLLLKQGAGILSYKDLSTLNTWLH